MTAEIISLAEVRQRRDEPQQEPDPDPHAELRLFLLRDIGRKLGLMPYEQWVAAGRPEGK